jgi:hypothetical protein
LRVRNKELRDVESLSGFLAALGVTGRKAKAEQGKDKGKADASANADSLRECQKAKGQGNSNG